MKKSPVISSMVGVRALIASLCLMPLCVAAVVADESPAYLVEDLTSASGPATVFATQPVALDDQLYFWGGTLDDPYGEEFWVSDGSAAGTRRFLDTVPGPASPLPNSVSVPVMLGDDLYFVACDGLPRCSLRKVGPMGDGGDVEILLEFEPIVPTVPRVFPMVAGEERLYFSWQTRQDQNVLWTSDGTAAGTLPLVTGLSVPPLLPDRLGEGDRLMAGQDRLWVSDGTPEGTLDLDVFDGNLIGQVANSGPMALLKVGLGASGRLWVSDGTVGGTRQIHDSLNVERLVPTGDGRAFVLSPDNDNSVWMTDGTPEGTLQLSSDLAASGLAVLVEKQLYFVSGPSGRSLSRSDGTVTGTQQIRQTLPLSLISDMIASDDFLYFVDRSADELWRLPLADIQGGTLLEGDHRSIENPVGFDGGLAFTGFGRLRLVGAGDSASAEVEVSSPSSTRPIHLTATGENDDLLFVTPVDVGSLETRGDVYLVRNGTGQRLRQTDGGFRPAAPGIAQAGDRTYVLYPDLQVLDPLTGALSTPSGNRPYPQSGFAMGDDFYFVDHGDLGIWRDNGESLTKLQDIEPWIVISELPFALECHHTAAAGDNLFFHVQGQLWALRDGSQLSNIFSGDGLFGECLEAASLGEEFFYVRTIENEDDRVTSLYKTDGTPDGTVELQELARDFLWSFRGFPSEPTVLGNRLFFVARDAEHGTELWWSDGSGTALFADIWPGQLSSRPSNLTVLNDRLYFTAEDGVRGRELWSTDGTLAGTALVADIAEGPASSSPQNLVAIDGRLLMAAQGRPEEGVELWKSDGTAAGTHLLQDIQPGSVSSVPDLFTAAGDTVYFQAVTEDAGIELWAMPRAALQNDPPPPPPPSACPSGTTCLLGDRFSVDVTWRAPRAGTAGQGQPIPFTDQSVLFWFFAPGNVELIVKVLDGCSINDFFWVFYGGVSDVEIRITVTDLESGTVREYLSSAGQISGDSDTQAFGCP